MASRGRAEASVGIRLAARRAPTAASTGLALWGFLVVVIVGLMTTLPGAFERPQRTINQRSALTDDFVGEHEIRSAVRVEDQSTIHRGAPLTIVAVDGSAAEAPPGVAALPAAGEIVVSPALARVLARPALRSELVERLPGVVVGQVGSAGLTRPNELLAYANVGPGRLGDGAARLAGWGLPPHLSKVEPLAPQLVVIVSAFAAVPLIGLGMLAIGAGRAGRARVVERLQALGAGRTTTLALAVTESLLPIAVGALCGHFARRRVAGLLAGRFPPAVRPFADDLVPTGAGAVLLVAAIVALLTAVALAYALSPAPPGTRVSGLRQHARRVAPVALWATAVALLAIRLRSVSDLATLDAVLLILLIASTPAVQVRFVALGLGCLAHRRSVVAQITEASYRANGSETTRAQQAVALVLVSVSLAAAAIVLWDAASLVDARWGLGRSDARVAWVSTSRSSAARIAAAHPSVSRLLRAPTVLDSSNETSTNIVVSCDEARALIVGWRPADCGAILHTSDGRRLDGLDTRVELAGVGLDPSYQRTVELRAPYRVVGSSSAFVLPVPPETFAAMDRNLARDETSDLIIVPLVGGRAQRVGQVERLRELTAPSVRTSRAIPFPLDDATTSNVLTLDDLERAGRRYRDVYGTAVRVVAGLAVAIGALAFFVGTLTDSTAVQVTTDRLELIGASRGQLVSVGLLRGLISLVVALITGGLVGTMAGVRYLRTPGYEDQLAGWSHGFPAATLGSSLLMALVVGASICVAASIVGVRPDPISRLKAE